MAGIINGFFEDDEENMHFFYTGRDNVIGLNHPDASLMNTLKYSYIRIATICCDQTVTSSEEVTADVCLDMAGVAGLSDTDSNSLICKAFIHGMFKNKRVIKDSFACVVSPCNNVEKIMEIYLTEEVIDEKYQVAVWLNTSEFLKIYVSKGFDRSMNSAPLNSEHLDSLYSLHLLPNSKLNSSTGTNSIATIQTSMIAKSNNIYDTIFNRLKAVETAPKPEFQYGYVIYPETFAPDYTSTMYNNIAPSSLFYPSVTTPFMAITTDRDGVYVKQDGSYQISLCSNITGGSVLTKNGDIELALYINNDKNSIVNIKNYIADSHQRTLTTLPFVIDLKAEDKLYVKLKLDGNVNSLIFPSTYLSVFRVL